MHKDDSEIPIITDFEDGVDAIEFLIDAFGFDDLDVLQEQDGEGLKQFVPDANIELVDVNEAGLEGDSFLFPTRA